MPTVGFFSLLAFWTGGAGAPVNVVAPTSGLLPLMRTDGMVTILTVG